MVEIARRHSESGKRWVIIGVRSSPSRDEVEVVLERVLAHSADLFDAERVRPDHPQLLEVQRRPLEALRRLDSADDQRAARGEQAHRRLDRLRGCPRCRRRRRARPGATTACSTARASRARRGGRPRAGAPSARTGAPRAHPSSRRARHARPGRLTTQTSTPGYRWRSRPTAAAASVPQPYTSAGTDGSGGCKRMVRSDTLAGSASTAASSLISAGRGRAGPRGRRTARRARRAPTAQLPRCRAGGSTPRSKLRHHGYRPWAHADAGRVDLAGDARQPRVDHDPLGRVARRATDFVAEHVWERQERGQRVVERPVQEDLLGVGSADAGSTWCRTTPSRRQAVSARVPPAGWSVRPERCTRVVDPSTDEADRLANEAVPEHECLHERRGSTTCPAAPATSRISSKPSRRQSSRTSGSGTAPVSLLTADEARAAVRDQRQVHRGTDRRPEAVEVVDLRAGEIERHRDAGHVAREEIDVLEHRADVAARQQVQRAGDRVRVRE